MNVRSPASHPDEGGRCWGEGWAGHDHDPRGPWASPVHACASAPLALRDPGHGSRDNAAATTQRAPMNDSRPPPPQRPQNIPSPFDASAPAAIPALTTAQRMAAVTMKTYRALRTKRSAKSGEASLSLNCPGNNVCRAKWIRPGHKNYRLLRNDWWWGAKATSRPRCFTVLMSQKPMSQPPTQGPDAPTPDLKTGQREVD